MAGLAVVVFSDLVDSTALLASGDAFRVGMTFRR